MAKKTITISDKIDREAEAFNAEAEAREAGFTAPDMVIACLAAVLDAVATLETAKGKAKGFVRSFILECALAGMTLAQVKPLYVADASWPSENGHKVGEKAARKTTAGDAYNSVQAVWNTLVLLDNGVPEIREGQLIGKGKETKVTAERFAALPAPVEAETLAHWQNILDAMSPENFDVLRADLDALGAPLDKLQKPAAKAA